MGEKARHPTLLRILRYYSDHSRILCPSIKRYDTKIVCKIKIFWNNWQNVRPRSAFSPLRKSLTKTGQARHRLFWPDMTSKSLCPAFSGRLATIVLWEKGDLKIVHDFSSPTYFRPGEENTYSYVIIFESELVFN